MRVATSAASTPGMHLIVDYLGAATRAARTLGRRFGVGGLAVAMPVVRIREIYSGLDLAAAAPAVSVPKKHLVVADFPAPLAEDDVDAQLPGKDLEEAELAGFVVVLVVAAAVVHVDAGVVVVVVGFVAAVALKNEHDQVFEWLPCDVSYSHTNVCRQLSNIDFPAAFPPARHCD